MNFKMIRYILGHIMRVEAILLLLPAVVSLLYQEGTFFCFLIPVLLLILLSALCSFKKPENRVIYAKEGFVIVALCWIVLSLFGALPFTLSGEIPSYVDSVFETVSGFTTTGASILTNVEGLSQGMLFWRSFTHWIGGMGVLVFVLAIIPLAGSRSMHLMRAESPGPSVGKLVPKIKSTAMILYGIYIGITFVEIILLVCGGMPLFDSVVTTFGTVGTGGFGIKNNSIAYYNSAYIDGVVTVFMILCGINFNIFYLLLLREFGRAFRSEELRWYLGIIACSILLVTLNILPIYQNFLTAFRYAAFQVGSIITTTGYATADFNLWPEFSKTILVLLMVLGACAGSTGGGIKTSRLVIALKNIKRELKHMLHPRSVKQVQLDGKTVEDEVLSGVNVYLLLYAMIVCISFLLISIDGFDFETTFTSVISAMGNIGPGLGDVGPVGNFSAYSAFSKIVLSLDMLFGRLEIFPMIMLFSPSLWRRKR